MDNIKKTIKKIRHFMTSRDIAPSRMAVMSGLHKNTLRGVHTDEWSPRLDTIIKLQQTIKKEERKK